MIVFMLFILGVILQLIVLYQKMRILHDPKVQKKK